jgi:hypothetical protein
MPEKKGNNKIMHETPENSTPVENSLHHAQILKMDVSTAQAVFNKLSLEEKVAIVLNTPWEKRQQLILLADNSQALVQALPDEEIYWTIKESGTADALPVIARTSFEQFQYIIDIDCWHKDRIDMKQVTEWLQLMLRCNESKVLEWLTNTDEQFLNYVFKKLFTISKISEDIDLAEASDTLPQWTLDGRYYFQFADEEARLVSIPFLHLLYKTDSKLFYYVMDNTIWTFATELEDEMFRLRQSRIAEKGFPELDEALQVYQFLDSKHIQTFLKSQEFSSHEIAEETSAYLKLRYGIGTEQPALFLQDILALIDNSQIIDRIQREIIHLSNQIIIADGLEAREIQDLKQSLHKASGYANIGLELLSNHDTETAAKYMEAVPMQFLFRTGYSQALDLRNRLQQLHKSLWQNYRPFRPLFFDDPWGATIEGLSQVRPAYFEGNSKGDSFLFRNFETIDEIRVTSQVLDIIAITEKVLFELFGITINNLLEPFITNTTLADSSDIRARALFLTILAQHVLQGTTELVPITETELRKFLITVFIKNETNAEPASILSAEFYPETLAWIRSRLELNGNEVTALKVFVESCLRLLQDECGNIAGIEHIDTRFVTAFIIRK